MKGAAWSVPVVAAAVAAPLAAASVTGVTITPNGTFSVPRCGTVATGLTFCVTKSGSPAGSLQVQITLPAGLQFTSGDAQQQTLTTPADGCVTVPPFEVTGATGSYSINATVLDTDPAVSAAVTGTVTAVSGTVVEFRSTYNWGAGNTAQTYTRTTGLTASEGGIAGNDVGNSYAAVIDADGQVQTWSGNTSWTGGSVSPTQLGTVANAIVVSTFDGNSGVAGGVAASTSTVWQWWGTTVCTVSGPTGTVLDVQAHAGYCYVLTTNGVWYWPTATSGTGPITATSIATPAGSAVIQMSSYYDSSNGDYGVAVIVGASSTATSGQLEYAVRGSTTFTSVTGASGVRQVAVGSAGLAAITTGNVLYTYADYATNAGVSPTGWTQRDTNVSSASVWGYSGYFGGLYVKNGAVTQMFGRSSYTTLAVGGLSGKTITKTFSSDGTYLALTSDGTVYYWYGNNDNWQARQAPTASTLSGVTSVVDLNVWGYHNGTYYGGGYVIEASPCPS